MKRDDFKEPIKKIIAERVGYNCSYPDCFAPTHGPSINKDKSVNVGVAAHITAASVGGPRFDNTISSEERSSCDNGIWLCSTHSNLIDKDPARFTVDLLREWKQKAEYRAMKIIGVPQGCSECQFATVSPVIRIGAEQKVQLQDGSSIHCATCFDINIAIGNITFFVDGFVLQFSIQRKSGRSHVVVDHLSVTVHKSQPIPKYRPLFAAYPTQISFFYVEIDTNENGIPRDFIPTRYFNANAIDTSETRQSYPSPIVIDDDIPEHIAIRFNALKPSMYLVSLDVTLKSGSETEKVTVLQPQWVIFKEPINF